VRDFKQATAAMLSADSLMVRMNYSTGDDAKMFRSVRKPPRLRLSVSPVVRLLRLHRESIRRP